MDFGSQIPPSQKGHHQLAELPGTNDFCFSNDGRLLDMTAILKKTQEIRLVRTQQIAKNSLKGRIPKGSPRKHSKALIQDIRCENVSFIRKVYLRYHAGRFWCNAPINRRWFFCLIHLRGSPLAVPHLPKKKQKKLPKTTNNRDSSSSPIQFAPSGFSGQN